MEVAIILPRREYEAILARLEKLEKQTQEQQAEQDKKVYTTQQAGDYLGMTAEGVRTARRQKRLEGFLINEKQWGFHQAELERYKNRYKRA